MSPDEIKKAHELHNKAMYKVEIAIIEKHTKGGDPEKVKKLYAEAFELERQAAEMVPIAAENEPSRSILYRSAANMAFNANMDYEAKEMCNVGLAGNPPQEIRNEIMGLLNTIQAMEHNEVI